MIKELMDGAVGRCEENGIALKVMQNGKEIYSYAAGLRDRESGALMSTDTICALFSCSKVVTAVASAILIERGLLDPLTELREIIPEFDNMTYLLNGREVPCTKPLRVRNLLNMTSGIPYFDQLYPEREKINSLWLETERDYKTLTTLEFAKRAAKCPLCFDAGEGWMYGGSADIMGAVIEVITGQRYSDFLKENIFEPLDMKDTGFYVPEDKLDRKAVLYDINGKKEFVDRPFGLGDGVNKPAFEGGGAGMFSTVDDFAKLGAMLAGNGVYEGNRILGRKTIEYLQNDGLTDSQRKIFHEMDSAAAGYGYANFLRIMKSPNEAGQFSSVGTFGWEGWSGTVQSCDVKENMSITIFMQRAGAGMTSLERRLVNAVYTELI